MIRIFLAFPLPENLSNAFLKLSDQNPSSTNIRWTFADNLHITLFFIGEVEETNLEKIKSTIHLLINDQSSFNLEFESVLIKNKKQSSMIWAAFKKNDSFSILTEKIFQNVKEFMTIKRTHEDPVPHCTLARIKGFIEKEKINLKTTVQPGTLIKVDHAELWQTIQTSNGVRYARLEKYHFNF
jgi:2'-5' RNA ligase